MKTNPIAKKGLMSRLCFLSELLALFYRYLFWVLGCCITLAVGRFLQGNPFPTLIKGNDRLHGFI